MICVGRTLLALYFLVPGLAKFLAPDMQLSLMETHQLPFARALLPIAGFAQVVGAILLISNRYVRLCSLGFVVYIIVINILMHDFWNFSGIIAAHELQNFIKNLGILAGLLLLAGISPARKLLITDIVRSDKAVTQFNV
jgi:putative oxidoreductase